MKISGRTLSNIYYLAILGTLSSEDIYLFLYVEPRLSYVLSEYITLAKKYRESVVISYIEDLLRKYRREDLLAQLKTMVAGLASVPEQRLKMIVPYIAHIIASVEREAIDLGLMDSRLEKIFERLYDALYKEKPKINEIVTQVSRLITLIEKAKISMEKEVQSVSRHTPRLSAKTIERDLVTEFVRLVYEYNKAGKEALLADVLNEFYKKFADRVNSIGEAYLVYKEALKNKYIIDRDKKLYVTDKGKELVE